MRTEFERGFYKASVYTASKNILSSMGNNEPTLCEIINLIRKESRRSRNVPNTVSKVEEQAAVIRSLEIRRVLGLNKSSFISDREYKKGISLLKKEMKRKGLGFSKYYLEKNS